MNNIINTRADLDALAGTPAYDQFMGALRGTLWRLEKDDIAKTWVASEDNSTIERFGFTRSEFPGAVAPSLPAYVPPGETTESREARAALTVLDAKSIRSMREYLASKPDAPAILKAFEAQVLIERAKVKP